MKCLRILIILLLFGFNAHSQINLKANYTYSNDHSYSTLESFSINNRIYTFISIRDSFSYAIKVKLIINDFDGNFISNQIIIDSVYNHSIENVIIKNYNNQFVIIGNLTNQFNLVERLIYNVCDLNGNSIVNNILYSYDNIFKLQDFKIGNNCLLLLGYYRRNTSPNYYLLNLKHNLSTNIYSVDTNNINYPDYDIYFLKDSINIIRFEIKQFNSNNRVYFKHVLLTNSLTPIDSVLDTSKFVLSQGTLLTNIIYNSIKDNIEIKGQFSNALGTNVGKENFDFMLKIFNTTNFKYLININFYQPNDTYQVISSNSLRYNYSKDTIITIHRYINLNNQQEFILSKFVNQKRVYNTPFVSDTNIFSNILIHNRNIYWDRNIDNITIYNANFMGDLYIHRFNSKFNQINKFHLNLRDTSYRYLYYVNAFDNNKFLLHGIMLKVGSVKSVYNISFYESTYTSLSDEKKVDISILPNPSNGTLYISNNTSFEKHQIKLYSLIGDEIPFEIIGENKIIIDNKYSGLLIVSILSDSKEVITRKIIVN